MITDDSYIPSPPKILCANGVFAADAPEAIRKRYAGLHDCAPEETCKTFYMPYERTGHTPERAAKVRVRYEALKPSKPRVRKVPFKPRARRGTTWNAMDHVTAEKIMELQSHGLTTQAIGERLGCSRDTILGRLRKHRKEASDGGAAELATRTCACGKRKWAKSAKCQKCRNKEVWG